MVRAPALAAADYKSEPAHADSAYVTAAGGESALKTTEKRLYELVDESANNNIATTSYVKGAYNATMKAINSLDFASKEGVVSTINNSTVTGTGNGTVTVYNTWGDESEEGQGTANVGLAGVTYKVAAPGNNHDTYHETYSGNARGSAYPQYTDTAGTRVFGAVGNDVSEGTVPPSGN